MGLRFRIAGISTTILIPLGVGAQVLDEAAKNAAVQSECGQHFWVQRGKAPPGFIKGMAASYAKTWCEATQDPGSVSAALSGDSFKPELDALALYGKSGGSQDDRLRSIYALAISEGMRESSGNTNEGYDSTVENQTAEIAEAGIFQVSHDSLHASPLLQKLWDHFASDPSTCNLSVFEEGVKKLNRPVVGSGRAAEFQRFTKACPAFAVEYAAVMMRANLKHFGPVKRKEAELLPICVAMFKQVELAARPLCSAAKEQSAVPPALAMPGPSEQAMRDFLAQGKWTDRADDNVKFTGEALRADFIKSLVEAYQATPNDANAIANLSLVSLAFGVAEWGGAPSGVFPPDPVKRSWEPVASTGDGKHLMSYSKGGIGVMHQDSGGLVKLMEYLETNHADIVPLSKRRDFFRLKGVNFDKLYAAGGHCTKPTSEIRTDLSGAEFQHTLHGYAGNNYCQVHNKPELKLAPTDWQVFRHGMREALRHEDVQFRLLRDFANNEWASAYQMVVVKGGHDVREALILARIWNSSPKLAKCAFEKAQGITKISERIQRELEAYSDGCPGSSVRMKERWPYMMRAVAAYDAFAKK